MRNDSTTQRDRLVDLAVSMNRQSKLRLESLETIRPKKAFAEKALRKKGKLWGTLLAPHKLAENVSKWFVDLKKFLERLLNHENRFEIE